MLWKIICPRNLTIGKIHLFEKTDDWEFRPERCIGCVICTSIFPQKAFTPEPVPKYRRPPAHYFSLGMKLAPGITRHLLTG